MHGKLLLRLNPDFRCQPEILKHLSEIGFEVFPGGGVHLGGKPALDSQIFPGPQLRNRLGAKPVSTTATYERVIE